MRTSHLAWALSKARAAQGGRSLEQLGGIADNLIKTLRMRLKVRAYHRWIPALATCQDGSPPGCRIHQRNVSVEGSLGTMK